MPEHFSKHGIRFTYPENWELAEEPVGEGQTVSVTSRGGAFWWLSIYPVGRNVAEIARAMLEGLRAEHQGADIEPVVEVFEGQEMVGYDINFVCLDLINTAIIRGFQTTQASYVMLWQAEDHEFEQVRPVFQAITKSLIDTAAEFATQAS
ncbi:MAG: hypothetical protein KDA42_13105 [Planctomycetales bacterium]|nr:hypothetical protein [Planctomycetales bacterium]